MKLRREKDKAEILIMLNTVLFGVGAGLVTLAWTNSVQFSADFDLVSALFGFEEPLLLITVAIMLGGLFHSFTILYPMVLENRAKQQKALKQVNNFKDQAYRDSLTSLYNRRYFDATLEAYFSEFNRLNLPFGLLVFDVDHFKRVNDTYGHTVGDEVLQQISRRAEALTREHDILARIGGEEFAVIIADVNSAQLISVAERFRQQIALLEIKVDGSVIRPTISVGAVLSVSKDNTADLMAAVDGCLYKAKEAGRNCIIVG